MGWDGGSTGTGWKHVKHAYYPHVQIWVRRFLDPAKPKNLEFPWGGYGMSGDRLPVPDTHCGASEHAAVWPNIPAAADAGSGAVGVASGGRSGAGMHAYMSPRVSLDELCSALVELFADADLPFRLVDRASSSHTWSLIAQTLERILTEADLRDVVFAVTTDNAENNNKAIRLLSGVTAEGPDVWTSNPLRDIAHHVRLREQLDKIRISDVHWDALVELKNSLKPFHSLTKVAEASLYPTAAAVVPLYNQLLDKLETTFRKPGVSPHTQALITKALGKLKKYPYGSKEELAIATFLHPRYKTIFFQLP
ncbi:unnamed protein product [Closterium sp. Yama58-4]|nr:unnamed protein product [Closterium sp. Yama58-4]